MEKYFKIKEFSDLTSVTVRALQIYDKLGLLRPSHKTMHQYRMYSEKDILRLQQIVTLKFMGFSLEEISKIFSKPGFNVERSLRAQAQSIAERAKKLEHVSKLMHELAKQLESENTINWETTTKIIEVIQKGEISKDKWHESYLSAPELMEFEKIAAQHTEEYWKKYSERWFVLYKEVEENLHTDPEGDVAMKLAKRWLGLVDEIYFNFPNLRKKLWEGYKAGIISTDGMPHNQKLIDYIGKATAKYKKTKVVNLNY